jgi:hypothetical protein
MRWVDEIANRGRPERLVFSRKTNKSDDLIIWFDQLNFISLHHHSILHAWTTRSRVASAYLRQFVSSILHQFVDFASSRSTIIQSRWFLSYVLIFEIVEKSMSSKIRDTMLMRSDRSDNEARKQLDQKKIISWRSKISILREISMNHEIRGSVDEIFYIMRWIFHLN